MAPEVIERDVLDIVSTLVKELRGAASPLAVAAHSSLERDLGISSLERVELLLRIERRFGVRLPDATVATAETPAELVAALSLAAPAVRDRPPDARPAVGAAGAAPTTAATLLEALEWHVRATPDRTHIFLNEDSNQERAITYRGLWDGAKEVAAALAERGVAPGDTVALMLRTEEAFFRTFAGVLFAGAVPVPMYPPVRADRIAEYAHRQAGILRNAGARLLVTFAEAERVGSILRGGVESLRDVVAVDELRSGGLGRDPIVQTTPDSPALIQYTSGSTGDPKGVLLSHGNILANIRAIGQAIDVSPDDVAASWLPLYHDMGLIGAWLGSMYFGLPVSVMSPLRFLSRPSRWLWAIHAHRATISPAPNFAFDLCVSKIADDEIEGLDLSSWRLALNGSEAVSADTIARFTDRFARYGFRPEAMLPVYGLAESSVGLTMPPLSRRPRIDTIAREPFQRAREIRSADPADAQPLKFVSCGHPIPGHDVRVVDESGHTLGPRAFGRIQFRGPSVTKGYYRNPEATRAAFAGNWLDSGDYGYWADSELFVTGRAKDLIIRGGRNITPQEAEEIAGAVAGVRKGCVAAFGVHDPAIGTERFVLVAETRLTDEPAREALRRDVAARVTEALGVPPDQVVIAPAGTVLKTPSGRSAGPRRVRCTNGGNCSPRTGPQRPMGSPPRPGLSWTDQTRARPSLTDRLHQLHRRPRRDHVAGALGPRARSAPRPSRRSRDEAVVPPDAHPDGTVSTPVGSRPSARRGPRDDCRQSCELHRRHRADGRAAGRRAVHRQGRAREVADHRRGHSARRTHPDREERYDNALPAPIRSSRRFVAGARSSSFLKARSFARPGCCRSGSAPFARPSRRSAPSFP